MSSATPLYHPLKIAFPVSITHFRARCAHSLQSTLFVPYITRDARARTRFANVCQAGIATRAPHTTTIRVSSPVTRPVVARDWVQNFVDFTTPAAAAAASVAAKLFGLRARATLGAVVRVEAF